MCAFVAWTPRSGRIGPGGPFYISAHEQSWNALVLPWARLHPSGVCPPISQIGTDLILRPSRDSRRRGGQPVDRDSPPLSRPSPPCGGSLGLRCSRAVPSVQNLCSNRDVLLDQVQSGSAGASPSPVPPTSRNSLSLAACVLANAATSGTGPAPRESAGGRSLSCQTTSADSRTRSGSPDRAAAWG